MFELSSNADRSIVAVEPLELSLSVVGMKPHSPESMSILTHLMIKHDMHEFLEGADVILFVIVNNRAAVCITERYPDIDLRSLIWPRKCSTAVESHIESRS